VHTANLERIAAEWQEALGIFARRSRELTGTDVEGIEAWIASSTPEQLEAWRTLVAETGFSLDPGDMNDIHEYFGLNRLRNRIEQELSTMENKSEWKTVFLKDNSLQEKMLMLDNPKVPDVLDGGYTDDQLSKVAEAVRYERNIAAIEATVNAKTGVRRTGAALVEQGILSGNRMFLLGISFVVCMVGIANAMLMSITERFKEIATMKCLGATDSYILVQFLIEAGIQGVAGGLLGMAIGFILAFVKNLFFFGGWIFSGFPVLGLAGSGIVSIAAGVILAMVASVYPSWAASRMAPMEAMRIE
jgi:hypothetical protein